MEELKTETFRMRITPKLKEELTAAAEKENRTVSNFVEHIIKKELDRINQK